MQAFCHFMVFYGILVCQKANCITKSAFSAFSAFSVFSVFSRLFPRFRLFHRIRLLDFSALMRTYLLGLAQFPICNFLYSQFPIPALFWPCCGMRLFTELGFSKFNLRKVFPLNSLFKFLHNGKYDN